MADIDNIQFLILASMLTVVITLLILSPTLMGIQHDKIVTDIRNATNIVENESKIDRGYTGNITHDIIDDISNKIDNTTNN